VGAIFNNKDTQIVSPSRTYVAAVYTGREYTGLRFVRFTLPESEVNHNGNASWYFLNVLDGFAYILDTFPAEFLDNVTDK
jgi:hypothetical protein